MKEKTVSYVLRLTLILFAITAISALLLGATNALTENRIREINREKTVAAIREVLPSDAEPEEILDFPDSTQLVQTLFRVGDDGYAVKVIVPGSQADIEVIVGVTADRTVSGISFVSMAETSGLGAVAAQDSTKGIRFREQFIGKSGSVAVTKDGGDIDALTGATVTSRAVATAVNAALTCVAENS